MKPHWLIRSLQPVGWFLLPVVVACGAEPLTITSRMHHLRHSEPREWSDFPEQPEAASLSRAFDGKANPTEMTLRLRQQDVKQNWLVALNGTKLGALTIDENDMVLYFAVPPQTLRERNTLTVAAVGKHRTPDDIRVGEMVLLDESREAVLSESTLHIRVIDSDLQAETPARITLVNEQGALASVGTTSNDQLAIRPGIIYTANGLADLRLPAGKYTVYAGRGFEYSLDECRVEVEANVEAKVQLKIRREVNTRGWIACDTHVHTRTHSGHGDATVRERMITLAGEAIELPIATDHNVHIDHRPFAREMNVEPYFTPVVGNEVTTRTGHFNIFPVQSGAPTPGYKSDDWKATLDGIFATPQVRVAILNHARDSHGGTTPFGPRHFHAAAGEMLDDWHVGFNAMEVINSGATQTDSLQLFRDWLALLNRGRKVTPVGSSDSHDVGRHFVGQGRTYLRGADEEPKAIDVNGAVDAFLAGRVVVSYGLFVELQLGDDHEPGDLVSVAQRVPAAKVVVRGPAWSAVDNVRIYRNGQLVKELTEDDIPPSRVVPGELLRTTITLRRPQHDAHLVALASGPGIDGLYWKTAKAYQPDSPDWTPRTFACTGPIYLDVDGDGKWSSPHDYAAKVVRDAEGDLPRVMAMLRDYDTAVATQAALLLHRAGTRPLMLTSRSLLLEATPETRTGLLRYVDAWRLNEQARGAAK